MFLLYKLYTTLTLITYDLFPLFILKIAVELPWQIPHNLLRWPLWSDSSAVVLPVPGWWSNSPTHHLEVQLGAVEGKQLLWQSQYGTIDYNREVTMLLPQAHHPGGVIPQHPPGDINKILSLHASVKTKRPQRIIGMCVKGCVCMNIFSQTGVSDNWGVPIGVLGFNLLHADNSNCCHLNLWRTHHFLSWSNRWWNIVWWLSDVATAVTHPDRQLTTRYLLSPYHFQFFVV